MQQQRPIVGSDGTVFLSATVATGGNWSLNAFDPANGTLLRNYFPSPGLGMWVRIDVSGTGLETADRPAGGSWSNPTVLATGTFSGFDLVVNATGDTAVIWNLGLFTANTAIYSSDRPAAGVWSPPSVVAPLALMQGGAQIGIAANGDLTACWRTNTEIRVADKPAGGNWSSSVTLCRNSAITGFPTLAKTPSGDDMTIPLRPRRPRSSMPMELICPSSLPMEPILRREATASSR